MAQHKRVAVIGKKKQCKQTACSTCTGQPPVHAQGVQYVWLARCCQYIHTSCSALDIVQMLSSLLPLLVGSL